VKCISVLAFDSKEFRRERLVDGIRQTIFYSPFGVGVKMKNSPRVIDVYHEIAEEKEKTNAILESCYIYSSNYLNKKYDQTRCTSFLEALIYGLQDFIEEVFFSYVTISPNITPEISVGGHFSPTTTVPTLDFFKQLSPMFSYISAWNYFQIERIEKPSILLDAFSSKYTAAWMALERNYDLKIYPHGDECNLPISLADIIAYVTDRRLNRMHLRLEPDSLKKVWNNFNFEVNTRILTQADLAYIAYFNYENIDWLEYQARPILFLDLESLRMQTMTEIEPYKIAIKHISQKNGSIQGFDEGMDSKRIQDGDIYVYAGEASRKRAETYSDIYNIEIYSVKELRDLHK